MRGALAQIPGRFVAAVWRDGGQGQARRNAWAAMVSDNVRARARAEADAAVRELAAWQAAAPPTATGSR
jgi:hypothetical protein